MESLTANKETRAQKPRDEAIPISGTELVRILLAQLAGDLAQNQFLQEAAAFPGAKVPFIALAPEEEDEA